MTPHTENALVTEARLRVRYAETDQMGVVYHSNFIIWMEVGRVELLRSLGFSYREMEQDNVHLPVVEVKCRYKSPARYDDLIVVRTRMLNLRNSLIHFGYDIVRESDNTVIAEGESVHLVVSRDMQRIPIPEKYMERFNQAAGKSGVLGE